MTRRIIVDEGAMKLWYHEDGSILHHEMLRYPGAQLLETVLNSGLEFMREHRVNKWLSDDRNGGALPKSHHEWGETVWGPKAAAAGWKYWALVPPEELVGRMNMERLTKTYGDLGVQVQVFATPVLALSWLRNIGNSDAPTAKSERWSNHPQPKAT